MYKVTTYEGETLRFNDLSKLYARMGSHSGASLAVLNAGDVTIPIGDVVYHRDRDREIKAIKRRIAIERDRLPLFDDPPLDFEADYRITKDLTNTALSVLRTDPDTLSIDAVGQAIAWLDGRIIEYRARGYPEWGMITRADHFRPWLRRLELVQAEAEA